MTLNLKPKILLPHHKIKPWYLWFLKEDSTGSIIQNHYKMTLSKIMRTVFGASFAMKVPKI